MLRKYLAWPIAGLLFLTALACGNVSGGPLPAGESAPEFGIEYGDKVVALSDYRGQVVIVNFWAST